VPADPAPPRILALRFSSIGDVVLTTPLLRALRARHPQAAITFVTKRAMAPLVANHPAVNEVLALEPGGSLFTLAAQLRQRRFTHLLDLHGTLRAGLLRLLVPGSMSGRMAGRRSSMSPRTRRPALPRGWLRPDSARAGTSQCWPPERPTSPSAGRWKGGWVWRNN
jgi:ADP-heptose:LPS heptosyltransferase